MDAVELKREEKRMCESYKGCDGCPANHEVTEDCLISATLYSKNFNPEKAVEIVEKWSAENPQETYRTHFLKNYPKAKLPNTDGGLPTICRNRVFYTPRCPNLCAQCWNEPFKED